MLAHGIFCGLDDEWCDFSDVLMGVFAQLRHGHKVTTLHPAGPKAGAGANAKEANQRLTGAWHLNQHP